MGIDLIRLHRCVCRTCVDSSAREAYRWLRFCLSIESAFLGCVPTLERGSGRKKGLGVRIIRKRKMPLDFFVEKHIVGNSLFLSAACSKVFLMYISLRRMVRLDLP
jgi:hypothetical protein